MDVADLQQFNFPTIGAYHTSATVRTEDNILYSSYPANNQTVNILENPEPLSTVIPGVNATVYDLEEDADYIYALTANILYKISKNNLNSLEEINLPALSNPEGFSFDTERNIYIADTGANRVVKLTASNNYQEDTTFILNKGGSEDGELLSPRDVTLSGQGSNLQVYVLDAGNNRIQIFNSKGNYLTKFDGSTTPDGKLNNPLNMIGGSNLFITDSGNNTIRELSYNSQTQKEQSRLIANIDDMGKVSYTEQGLFIANNSINKLLSVSNQGDILQKIPMSESINIALFYEQDHQLIYQEKGSNQLKHIFIPKTTEEHAPLALSKKFVQAYLANDVGKIKGYTSARLLRLLKAHDVKAREAFSGIISYTQSIYMYGRNAEVQASTQVSSGIEAVSFFFIWQNGRWLLSEIM